MNALLCPMFRQPSSTRKRTAPNRAAHRASRPASRRTGPCDIGVGNIRDIRNVRQLSFRDSDANDDGREQEPEEDRDAHPVEKQHTTPR